MKICTNKLYLNHRKVKQMTFYTICITRNQKTINKSDKKKKKT